MPPRKESGAAIHGDDGIDLADLRRDTAKFRRDNDDLRRQVELLTRRLEESVHLCRRDDDATVTDENPFGGHPHRYPESRSQRWEHGFKVEIPQFDGSLNPEEFIDWLSEVEKILDFKAVPEERRVSVVKICLHGHAQVWWKQLKRNRVRTGKAKISNWEKFKKHIRAAFLPCNFDREVCQRFPNLHQFQQPTTLTIAATSTTPPITETVEQSPSICGSSNPIFDAYSDDEEVVDDDVVDYPIYDDYSDAEDVVDDDVIDDPIYDDYSADEEVVDDDYVIDTPAYYDDVYYDAYVLEDVSPLLMLRQNFVLPPVHVELDNALVDVGMESLTLELSSIHEIQHNIDVVMGAVQLHRVHYFMSSTAYTNLCSQREIISSDVFHVPSLIYFVGDIDDDAVLDSRPNLFDPGGNDAVQTSKAEGAAAWHYGAGAQGGRGLSAAAWLSCAGAQGGRGLSAAAWLSCAGA